MRDTPVCILIADANPDVRDALRLIIEQKAVLRIAGEARDTISLIGQILQICPDVTLLDVELPGVKTDPRRKGAALAEFIETIHNLCPTMRVIALSSQPTDEKVCLAAQADAFICKSDPPDALLAMLEKAAI